MGVFAGGFSQRWKGSSVLLKLKQFKRLTPYQQRRKILNYSASGRPGKFKVSCEENGVKIPFPREFNN
jgi:hypothetical protein